MREWFEDLTARRFGRLVVIKFAGKNKWNIATWECSCDCGGKKTVCSSSLKCGYTKSCGCISKERPSHTKHGGKGTKLYTTWKAMRERCYTKSSSSYSRYGGIGVKICEEWNDFSIFKKWAMENGYSEDLTIDRINPYGNYEPSNCRWVTKTQQSRNKKDTVYIKINNKLVCLADYAEETNNNYGYLYTKYKRKNLLFKKLKEDFYTE